MSTTQGGKFGAGFLSGGFGSAFGGKVGKWLQNARDFPKFIGTTIAGGISGGVGSRIAGGKFWDGFRNGAISAGLNHGVHDALQSFKEARYFKKQKEAYDFMWEKSFKDGKPYKEVSGWVTDDDGVIVLPNDRNTITKSYNDALSVKKFSDGRYVKYGSKWYKIKTHVHTHPSNSDWGIGVSHGDVQMINYVKSPIHILYKSNLYSVKGFHNYKNLGKW